MRETQCFFNEPWIGRCKEHRIDGSLCCEMHTRDKCNTCGQQATTRCQASIGLMCGTPLCRHCGVGEMCLSHASKGPLAIIRGLLGFGAVRSIFSTPEEVEKYKSELLPILEQLRSCSFANPLSAPSATE